MDDRNIDEEESGLTPAETDRLVEHLLNYERSRKPGDPDQYVLSEMLSKHFSGYSDVKLDVIALNFIHARSDALSEIWPESGLEQAKKLKSLKKSIREIAIIYNSLPGDLKSTILYSSNSEPDPGALSDLNETERAQRYLRRLTNRDTPGLMAYSGLQFLAEHWNELIPAIDEAIDESKKGYPEGNKKIEEWRLIDACSEICRLYPGHVEVPEKMNSTADFFGLVSDVFALYDIENDPVDYFNSWRDFLRKSRT